MVVPEFHGNCVERMVPALRLIINGKNNFNKAASGNSIKLCSHTGWKELFLSIYVLQCVCSIQGINVANKAAIRVQLYISTFKL